MCESAGFQKTKMAERSVFVTVGTTSFDRLIEAVSRREFIEVSYAPKLFVCG